MISYIIDKNVYKSKKFLQFEKYILRGLQMPDKEKMRLFHSRAEDTIHSYTKVIKEYVKFSEDEPFPATELSVRHFINSLSVEEDRTTLKLVKSSFVFAQKCRSDPMISFNTSDLILEGILREIGNNFKKPIRINQVRDIDVRKFLLRALYGASMREPYNEKLSEFRTGLRCLTSLFCLSRCADYQYLKKEDILIERDCVIISWRKRKNNQRAERQTSLLPCLMDHPLDPRKAFKHWFKVTKLKDDQFLNAKLSRTGKAVGDKGISRSTCYADNKKICSFLRLPSILEKFCKSLGTR